MWYIKKALHERHEKINILVSDVNAGNRTYDGLQVCGERIANEVRDKIETLATDGTEIKKISFVGYSLGGLGARYAIGVLQSTNFFDRVTPVNFTTFATPHLGVSPTSGGFFAWLMSSLGPKTLSVTGSHIFLADAMLQNKRPLLEVMTDPQTPFYQGLNLFQTRAAYANIVHDRSVPYYTAAISDEDPFSDMSKVVLHHDSRYGDTILDQKTPWTPAGEEKPEVREYPLTYRELAFRGAMIAGLPLWITLYSANAVIANYKSARRVTTHREEYPDHGDSIFASMTQDAVEEALDTKEADPTAVFKLSTTQSKMVANLNKLTWDKYRVHIQKTQHSHAAIVCRTKDSERLTEGHNVMRHWLDNVFSA